MLGFPSTTEVMRVLPKVAFYENLKLKPLEKKLFVSQIDKITLTNSIKASTMSIKNGDKYDELLVLQIDLKKKEIDGSLLEAIARQNHRPVIFVCNHLNESCVYVYRQRLYDTGWKEPGAHTFDLTSKTVDDLWNNICSQIALGEAAGVTTVGLDGKLFQARQITTLEAEVKKLTERSRKEKQPAKKNRLFEDAQTKQHELDRLKAEG